MFGLGVLNVCHTKAYKKRMSRAKTVKTRTRGKLEQNRNTISFKTIKNDLAYIYR